MKLELHYYDVFPKVFLVNEPVTITVKPLGKQAAFQGDYEVAIMSMAHGNPNIYPERKNLCQYEVSTEADGCLSITHIFKEESEYILRITGPAGGQFRTLNLSVYALEEDMRGRYPVVRQIKRCSIRQIILGRFRFVAELSVTLKVSVSANCFLELKSPAN